MVSSQGTSFIPTRPTKGKVRSGSVRKIYLLSYISYVLFFCTIIAAGGIFLYELSLNNQLAQQQDLLEQERKSFNQSDLVRVQELDFRIDTAMERLNNHVSVVSILSALEQSIVDSVYFLDFNYSRLAGGRPEIAISAKADGFNAVLFQKEVFDASQVMKRTSFSSVSMQTETSDENPDVAQEVVTFTMTTGFDPSLILYKTESFINTNNFVEVPNFIESDDVGSEEEVSAEGLTDEEGLLDNSESL